MNVQATKSRGSTTKTRTAATTVMLMACVLAGSTAWAASTLPDVKVDSPISATGELQTAVFAGGCFWGVDAVFRHVKGVDEVESGYAGGNAATAQYEKVSSGNTGHAEAVRVKFNPAEVSYQQLLRVFFTVAHDPTQLNRQGPDIGSQYRSAIFFSDVDQQKAAQNHIQQLAESHTFPRPIVTQLVPLQTFYPAEQYHQNYLALHPDQPYIVYNDLPKLEHLKRQFPALYR
ncbi:MAG: peptide-methionine (S)-S-oxide reductase MsrA [Propionivibrio sp.]